MPRIPLQFTLMNRDYQVRKALQEEADKMESIGLLGHCDYDEALIILGKHSNRDSFEHTYYHELAHALLVAAGKPKLSEDEALVDALGAALHQYEKTKEGSLPAGTYRRKTDARKKAAKPAKKSRRRS